MPKVLEQYQQKKIYECWVGVQFTPELDDRPMDILSKPEQEQIKHFKKEVASMFEEMKLTADYEYTLCTVSHTHTLCRKILLR